MLTLNSGLWVTLSAYVLYLVSTDTSFKQVHTSMTCIWRTYPSCPSNHSLELQFPILLDVRLEDVYVRRGGDLGLLR
jgi:hypothetical protein